MQPTVNTIPTGSIRTFGDYGVKYIVGTPAKQLPDGDWLVNIELPESGEHTHTNFPILSKTRKLHNVRNFF